MKIFVIKCGISSSYFEKMWNQLIHLKRHLVSSSWASLQDVLRLSQGSQLPYASHRGAQPLHLSYEYVFRL